MAKVYGGSIFLLLVLLTLLLTTSLQAQNAEVVVNLNIPSQYRTIQQGNSLLVETELLLVREKQDSIIDILIEYTVRDPQGQVVTQFSETKGTLLRINTIKDIPIPATVAPGIYTLEVNASYNGHSSKDTVFFDIAEFKKVDLGELRKEFTVFVILFAAITLFFLTILYYEYFKFKRLERTLEKVGVKDLKNEDIWKKKR